MIYCFTLEIDVKLSRRLDPKLVCWNEITEDACKIRAGRRASVTAANSNIRSSSSSLISGCNNDVQGLARGSTGNDCNECLLWCTPFAFSSEFSDMIANCEHKPYPLMPGTTGNSMRLSLHEQAALYTGRNEPRRKHTLKHLCSAVSAHSRCTRF